MAPPPDVHNTRGSCGRPFVGLSRGGPQEVFQLRCLYDTYMTSPRASAKCVRIPTKYEARVFQHPRDALRDPGPGSFSRVFVCIEPFLTDRAVFEKTIPSQGVLGCPRDRHLEKIQLPKSAISTLLSRTAQLQLLPSEGSLGFGCTSCLGGGIPPVFSLSVTVGSRL